MESLHPVAQDGSALWHALWHALHDVWLWAAVSREERAGLFGPSKPEAREQAQRARREAPGLTEALGTFTLLRTAADVVDSAQLAAACEQVYRWAERKSLIPLAAYFAEAAAMADSADPARANEGARLCRRAALPHRAASWYERAFQLAVRAHNRRESVWAQLGYASLLYTLGEYERARPYFEKVARRALHTGRRRTAAEAHHDLMGLFLDRGDYDQALQHARRAESLYPRHAKRIPYLVHDCAVLLIRGHFYSPALAALAGLPSHFPRPEESTFVWATIAQAAAGAGEYQRYREASQKALQLVGLYEEHGAAVMVSLAAGAVALGDADRATSYANLAVQIAERRRAHVQAERARQLLRRVERGEPAPVEVPAPEEIIALSRTLAARSRLWARRGPRAASAALGAGRPPAG